MWRVFISRVRSYFSGHDANSELNQEVHEHLRSLTDRYIRQGMAPAEADRAARRQFGSVTQLCENQHEARGLPFIETSVRDLIFGARLLRKELVFSAIAIGVLALGISANTVVYSIAKAVIFAPLPFPNPDRVAMIFEADRVGERFQPGQLNLSSVRPGSFQDWREQSHSFRSMAAIQNTRATIFDGDRSSVVDGYRVGDRFFETLGVSARLGRHFIASDFISGDARIIVLSDRLWRARYNADPSIIGREIVLDGSAHRVIGVMPPGFLPTAYGNDPQFWIPFRWSASEQRSFVLWGYLVYARLKDGVTVAQAQAEMDIIAAHMRVAHPADFGGGSIVAPLSVYLFSGRQRLFTLLLAAVALVLLIACANVANLLLARALKRQREFAVRSALGASRTTILRQVLVESLLIASLGGLLGAALSPLLLRSLVALLAQSDLPRLDQVRIDTGVLMFAAAISISSGLLFGIIPAIRAGRGDLSLRLRSGGRGSSAGRNERRVSDVLMVAEIAFSLVLLVGAGMLTRAFLKLVHTDPGFRPEHAIAVRLVIPTHRYGAYEEGGSNISRRSLYKRLEESTRSITEVEVSALTAKAPILQFWNPDGFAIEGRPPAVQNGSPIMLKRWGIPMQGMVCYQTVSPGYFQVLGIPIVRGRSLDSRDRAGTALSAIVNQALVRKFFPNENPIGHRIAVDRGTDFLRRMIIVGIVADARLDGVDQPAQPEVFASMDQLPSQDTWIVARARGDADSIESALRKAVHNVDSELGIVQLETMKGIVSDSLWRERFSALLVGLFAGIAALMAGGGLYAVISHAVEQRSQEVGVRLALGAAPSQIAFTVLGHGFRVTAIGMTVGAVFTLLAGRLVAHEAYQIAELPWIFGAVASFLLALTVLACWVPLRRALAVDPVAALRSE